MAVLSNPKHEKFAQLLASGMGDGEAYERAGYKYNHGNASRLRHNEKIKGRVQEIVEAGAIRAEITVQRVLEELGRVGFSDLRNVFTSEGGILEPQEWGDDVAAAIGGIEVVKKATGERDENDRPVIEYVHKIKVWDKVSALEKIGKHLNMFTDNLNLTGGVTLNVSKDDADL